MSTLPHEALIRRVLGTNYLQLHLAKLVIEEDPRSGAAVKIVVHEGEQPVEVEGEGVRRRLDYDEGPANHSMRGFQRYA